VSCYYPLYGKGAGPGQPLKMMAALAPETAFQAEQNTKHGIQIIPCGKCYGCQTDKRLMWTIRNTHEAKEHQNVTFLTLTYDDEHLPWHGSLSKTILQKFLKRLRHECERVHNPKYTNSRVNKLVADCKKIRFFAAGEYGTTSKRAHYHALLYGLWPQDAERYGSDSFTSESLSKLWTEGSHQFSRVNPDRIAYVCGYTIKKMGSIRDREPYTVEGVDTETGEVIYAQRQPEFAVMSRRPGIGSKWFEKYERDLRRGFLHHEGSKVTIPRFYERKYQERHPEEVEERRQLREQLRERKNPVEQTIKRLRVKERVKKGKDEAYKPQRYNPL